MTTEPTEKHAENSEDADAPPLTPMQKLWQNWVKPIGTVVIVLSTFRSAIADWNDVPSGSMEPTIAIGDRVLVNKLAYGLHVPFTGPKFSIPFTGIAFSNPLRGVPSLDWSSPQRGDIVTLWSPLPDDSSAGIDGTRLIKRVVAIAGDQIEWTADGRLIITTPDGTRDEATYDAPRSNVVDVHDAHGRLHRINAVQAEEHINGDTRTIQILQRGAQNRPFPEAGEAYVVPDDHVWVMGDNRDLSADSRVFGPVPVHLVTGRSSRVAFSHQGWNVAWGRTLHYLE